jgi:hypothetical protein
MFTNEKGPEVQSGLVLALFQRDQHRIRIFKILRDHLFRFSTEFLKVPSEISPKAIEYEDYISKELVDYYNNKAEETGYLLTFQGVGPDIFVRQKGQELHKPVLLYIEAKRLYSGAKKDYVSSGIARFKNEGHGKKDDIAVMLGYVQEYDFDHWHSKVNSWIDDLIPDTDQNPRWENQDKLTAVNISDIAEYTSKHSRIQKKPIKLHHFWINLCN